MLSVNPTGCFMSDIASLGWLSLLRWTSEDLGVCFLEEDRLFEDIAEKEGLIEKISHV